MRTELNRLISQVKDEDERKVCYEQLEQLVRENTGGYAQEMQHERMHVPF